MSDWEEKNEVTVIAFNKNKTEEHQKHPFFIQLSGRQAGHSINLSTQPRFVMGRDPECDLFFDDPHISRQHAEIFYSPNGAVTIKDLGSTNGLFINGVRVQTATLQENDKLLVGTRLYFKFCYQDRIEYDYQQHLFRAGNIDALTQVYNRKFLTEALSREFSFAKRTGQHLSVVMLDVDHFKKINDTYGHQGGDQVLKTLGQFLLKHLRQENISARYGGEEFVILLRNSDAEKALLVAERLREGIALENISYDGKTIHYTVSLGIACFDGKNFDTFDDLLKQADESLYIAKNKGRNQTFIKLAA